MTSEDIIRVIRIIEYVGPRSKVEENVRQSIHGVKDCPNGLKITAVTLGEYPDVLASRLQAEIAEAADIARLNKLTEIDAAKRKVHGYADANETA